MSKRHRIKPRARGKAVITADDLHRSETADMISAMEWLSYKHPLAFEATHHSPNGELRDEVAGAKLKKMGTKPGFPDLITYLAAGAFRGLVMECKSDTGKPSPAQAKWLKHFEQQKYYVAVPVGFDQIIQTYDRYLQLVDWL